MAAKAALKRITMVFLSMILCFTLMPGGMQEAEAVEEPNASEEITISSFDFLEANVSYQEYGEGEISLDSLLLPASLFATDDNSNEISIEGVTWSSDGFDPDVEAIYTFTPVLPQGYILLEGSALPQIIVEIKATGSSALGMGEMLPMATVTWDDITGPPTLTSANDGDTVVVESTASGILTIPAGVNSLTIIGPDTNTVIYARIEVANTSDCSLTISNLSLKAPGAYGALERDTSTSTLTLCGTNVYFEGGTGTPGIYMYGSGPLIIGAGSTITTTGGFSNTHGGNGLYSGGDLIIKEGATLTATGGNSDGLGGTGLGLGQTANIYLAGNLVLTAGSGTSQPSAHAISKVNSAPITASFTNPAARLTLQDDTSATTTLNINMNFAGSEKYEFKVVGGASIVSPTQATSSSTAGTLFLALIDDGRGLAGTGDTALPIGMATLAILVGVGVLLARRKVLRKQV